MSAMSSSFFFFLGLPISSASSSISSWVYGTHFFLANLVIINRPGGEYIPTKRNANASIISVMSKTRCGVMLITLPNQLLSPSIVVVVSRSPTSLSQVGSYLTASPSLTLRPVVSSTVIFFLSVFFWSTNCERPKVFPIISSPGVCGMVEYSVVCGSLTVFLLTLLCSVLTSISNLEVVIVFHKSLSFILICPNILS